MVLTDSNCVCGGKLKDSGGFRGQLISELVYTCDNCGRMIIIVNGEVAQDTLDENENI
jgi:hypothetical protein